VSSEAHGLELDPAAPDPKEGGKAAARGLDWEQLARAAAHGPRTRDDATLLHEFLTFQLAGDPYAVPVERVREIVRMRPVTPIPRVPAALRGVISLRGEIVEVVDLRLRLGLTPTEPTRTSRIIVLHGDDGKMSGLLVDAVTDVLRVAEDAIRSEGQGESGRVAALCVRGDQFISVLDFERVLDLGDEL
jgi:purine-binding chemotaxis protein CheW